MTLDVPRIKSTFLFNLSFSFGITPAADTVKTFENDQFVVSEKLDEYRIDTYSVNGPEIRWEIRTDERYGFDIALSPSFFLG